MEEAELESGVRVDGKYWNFHRITNLENCKKFLDTREGLNKLSHRDRGGRWPAPLAGGPYQQVCGLTGKVIEPEDGILLTISWQAGVPNVAVSLKATEGMTDEQLARKLAENWKKAQEAMQQYAAWMR